MLAFSSCDLSCHAKALRVAQHQVRLAQATARPRMEDALVGLEDALSDQITCSKTPLKTTKLMRLSDDKPAFLENVARFGEGGTSALSAIRVWWIGSPTSVASGPVGNLSMRRRDTDDDDSLPVMVPRSDMVLVPTSASRVRWLREHLIAALRELRMAKHQERIATPVRPEPTGFAAKVARTACSLCKGWCCRNGGDDAFLDDRTLARVRLARPAMDERAVLRLYLERVPTVAYQNSCIFHGKRGCALDRSLRADICNSYFCGGLGAYMKTSAAVPTMVIAGEGDKMRTSPVLMPQSGGDGTFGR